MEKYMAIMIREKLVFIDKIQFMSSGLENLIEYLPKRKLSICPRIPRKSIRRSETKKDSTIGIYK